jgi:hypothetical protein
MTELCFLSHMSSEQLASWVQAVGSIGAIIGAFAVVWYQTRESKKRDKDAAIQERAEKASGLVAICELARDQADLAATAFQGDVVDEFSFVLSYNERFFNETMYTLNLVQLIDMGFPSAVPGFIHLKLAFGSIGRAIDTSRFGDGSEQRNDQSLCLDIRGSQELVHEYADLLRDELQ